MGSSDPWAQGSLAPLFVPLLLAPQYNAVEDSISVAEGLPCSPALPEETPLGLLVARQVISDLSIQIRKEVQVQEIEFSEIVSTSEQIWCSKVAQLTSEIPSALSIQDLNYRLVALTQLLSVAPYEENAVALLPYVKQVRHELSNRRAGPKSIVRKTNSQTDSS